MEEKPDIGDIVKVVETGRKYPVVGYEQGGRTVQLPSGPGGTTRGFFWKDNDDLELVEENPSTFRIYQTALGGFPADYEIAKVIAALVDEGVIPEKKLLGLKEVLDENQLEEVHRQIN